VAAPHLVEPARPGEWRALGQLLGRSFHDDPVWSWVAPVQRRRERHLGAAFGGLIRNACRRGDVWTTADRSGAAVWLPPDGWRTTRGEMLRMAVPMGRTIGFPLAFDRISTLEAMDAHHPTEPHWYLLLLGADPDRRGQGIGSALLAPMLERCDAEGLPAYLESSNELNVPLYHRFGFEVTEEYRLAPDSPPLWAMWRTPR
jgi:GNAT superfamily N-acetyltransferase